MLTNVSCSQDGQGIVDETLAQYRCLLWYDIFSFWLHSIKTWKVNLKKKRNKELDLSWVLSNAVMNGRCKPNDIWPNLLTYKVKEDDNCHKYKYLQEEHESTLIVCCTFETSMSKPK